ncbi:MAG: class I SAM-dependent RNA methyltransferase [Gemmatimonadetes bacterium]|nr:class I SAM-dependent RNA methyltransferase [Gemmatimonadota bacterium]
MIDASATLTIASIAAGGDGVGRTEGVVVFVPRTAPGDVARVRLARAKRFARGELIALEERSPARIEPPCHHYTDDRCGGCQIQHLSYEAQLEAKRTIIGDSLRRIGRRDVADPDVEASDLPWRYRRKLTLHLRRTHEGWIAGLHPYDDPAAVFDLVDCPITDERVLAIWAELRGAFDALPPERALRVAVRLLDDGAAATVEGGHVWRTADALLAGAPSLTELWWRPEGGATRRVGARSVESRAGAAFVQVNARVAARLQDELLRRVRARAPERVVDAYAGSGATAIPLARDGRTVVAIELDRPAVDRMRSQLDAPSSAIAGRVEDHLERQLPADVVILNPPRAGVDERVTAALERNRTTTRALFYVSCDPATLARDLARLPGYRLVAVRGYDMFPQTAHVETLCELEPVAR